MDIYVVLAFGVLTGYLLSKRSLPNDLSFKLRKSLETFLNMLVYPLIFSIGLRSVAVLSEFLTKEVESIILVLLLSVMPLIFSVVVALVLIRGVSD